jgi:RNA polymerase sigma factor (TIGR02999 family)
MHHSIDFLSTPKYSLGQSQRGQFDMADSDVSGPVSQLLIRWKDGQNAALETLLPIVYDELRRVAHHYLQGERPGHTLQSTALVHEAYLRLAVQQPLQLQNRAHFFAVAAQLMRQILVDYARNRKAAKRRNDCKIALDEAVELPQKRDLDVLALDEALKELARLDSQQARIVELRFFGGLSIEETSDVLEISPARVKRDWATARAWLYREMDRTGLS